MKNKLMEVAVVLVAVASIVIGKNLLPAYKERCLKKEKAEA